MPSDKKKKRSRSRSTDRKRSKSKTEERFQFMENQIYNLTTTLTKIMEAQNEKNVQAQALNDDKENRSPTGKLK